MSFKVSLAAGAPIVGAMPAPPVTTERESSASTVETRQRELVKRWMQIVENGWREIIRAIHSSSKIEDVVAPVNSETRALLDECREDFPPEETSQMLLFVAKLPAVLATEQIKQEAERHLEYWCGHLTFFRFAHNARETIVLEAVILNAAANDHNNLVQNVLLHNLHLSLVENPQFFALAYSIAEKKRSALADMMMATIPPPLPKGWPRWSTPLDPLELVAFNLKNFSLLTRATFLLLAKRISIVNEYVQREPFDLDTVMIVWDALGLNEREEKEVVIASLEARIGSLPDGEEKGRGEAFRNKIREGR